MGTSLFRAWVVLSLLWLGYVYVSRAAWTFPIWNVALWPVGFVAFVFVALTWIAGGFRRNA